MKSKKVHMKDYNYINTIACNRNITYIGGKEFSEFEKLPEERQCKSCLKTKAYVEVKEELERKRPLEKGEFEEPFEVFKYEVQNTYPYKLYSKCKYKNEKLIGGFVCESCEHHKEKNMGEKIVKCSYKHDNKKNGSNEPKTQLQKDKEKYNLNDEQVEILEGVDYEIVPYDVINNTCQNCILQMKCRYISVNISCRIGLNNGIEDIIFKQIHKTQSSLNKSIEDEGLKDIEVPFSDGVTHGSADLKSTMIKIDTTNLQRAAKETSEKMGESIQKAMKDFGDNMQAKRKGDSNEQNSDHYKDTPDKYKFTINNRNGESIVCDVYDIAESIGVLNTAHFHALKKVLCPGIRGSKGVKQDLTEANKSLEIAILLNERKEK